MFTKNPQSIVSVNFQQEYAHMTDDE